MKEKKDKLDEIFSNALKDFKQEPSPEVWESIKGALPINPVSKGIFTKYVINTAAAIIVVSALIFTSYHFYHKANTPVNTTALRNPSTEIKNNININNNHVTTANYHNHIQGQNKTSDNAYNSNKSSSQPAINKPVTVNKQQPPVSKNALETNNKEIKAQAIASNNISKRLKYIQPSNNIETKQTATSQKENSIGNNQTISKVTSQTPDLLPQSSNITATTFDITRPAIDILSPASSLLLPASDIKPSKIKPLLLKYISSYNDETYAELAIPLSGIYPHKIFNPDYYISLNYTPEYFTSHSNLLTAKADFANTTDLSLTISWRRLTLRTGLGISFYNTDKYNYTVNYAKNQSIGTYSKVDSVSFSIIDNAIVPKYYTSQITVYNKVNQIYQSQVDKKYAYLQIPLIVGCRLNDMNRLTFTLNAGPVLSLTMFKKAGEITYPDNAVEIIDVKSNEISRVSSYWDMLVSLGINYRLTGRLSLNIEPQYKSSIGSVYTTSNPQLKKPYSVGLRSGIMFKL